MSDLLTPLLVSDMITDLSKEFIYCAHKVRYTSPTLIIIILDLEVGVRGIAHADYSSE